MIEDQRFEHRQKQRYYRIMLSQDLFGDWIVIRVWGGIKQATGRIMQVPYSSYEEALVYIKHLANIRKRRGYEFIEQPLHKIF